MGRDQPGLRLRIPGQATVTRSWPSMMVYGVAYAAASLSCTIGPFLAIVVASARAGSALQGAALFLACAVDMGPVVGGAAHAVALAHVSALGRVRRLAPVISRLAGALLLAARTYIAYYGWYEIRLLNSGSPDDPVISAATDLQRRPADTLDTLGAPTIAGIVIALIAVGLAVDRGRRPPGTASIPRADRLAEHLPRATSGYLFAAAPRPAHWTAAAPPLDERDGAEPPRTRLSYARQQATGANNRVTEHPYESA